MIIFNSFLFFFFYYSLFLNSGLLLLCSVPCKSSWHVYLLHSFACICVSNFLDGNIYRYASFRAMETESHSRNQQCLTFWVLFALLAFFEAALSKLLLGLPFWPYVKGVVTVLLVMTDFGGASYIYKSFIRTYPFDSSRILCLIWNLLFILTSRCFSFICELFQREKCFSFYGTDGNIVVDGEEKVEKPIIFQGTFRPNNDNIERDHTSTPLVSKNVQKEWSCALCLISTTSEKCLKKHLRGKKHKGKKDEVRAEELILKSTYNSCHMVNRNNGMVLLGNLVNLEKWSGLISPVTGSIRWCIWKKPDVGWIKLNTDGSVDRQHAGFGGLLRDNEGNAICAFVSKAPLDDIFLVELWAIWRGLVLALGLGIKVIWVESDSMSAVKTINRVQSHSGKANRCLNHIWALLKKFEEYKVSHAWRETNKAADYLSKMVLERNDVVLWPVHFPTTLQNIIKDDAQGRIYCRR
eukprot:XP_015579763.1 uncharacterized protein LOC8280347 isoform X1 [Ricinus communis]